MGAWRDDESLAQYVFLIGFQRFLCLQVGGIYGTPAGKFRVLLKFERENVIIPFANGTWMFRVNKWANL